MDTDPSERVRKPGARNPAIGKGYARNPAPPPSNDAAMHVDSTSLTELGLVPDASGAWPLASWLDTTHSSAAYTALKHLIAAPLGDVEQIRARQALLVQLVPVRSEIPWASLEKLAAQVERYLASNYVIVPSPLIERTVFGLRFRAIVDDVTTQLRAVDTLLTLSDQVYTRIRALEGDAGFIEVRAAIAAAVNHPRRLSLRSAVARDRGVSTLDRVVRDTKAVGAHASQEMPTAVPMRFTLLSLVAALAQLDAFCSLANASAALAGTVPNVESRRDAALVLDGLWHPLLPGGVTSDVALSIDERVLFLTGPNMAGKSTLLRAMGIAVYCAHLGMAVSARRACIPLYDEVLVSITVRDNLRRGESLYLAEVRRMRKIVDAVDRGDAVLAICDEVFRGTNINDATDATQLLVDGLARAGVGTFVIASHLAHVAESRALSVGVACWCMEVELGDIPRFSYRARRGVSDVHLGMVLLDAEGVGPVLRRMAGQ